MGEKFQAVKIFLEYIRKRHKLFIHIASWLMLFVFNVHITLSFFPVQHAFLRSSLFLGILIFVFYFNSNYLIPHFFVKRRYILYALFLLVIITVAGQVDKLFYDFFKSPIIFHEERLNHHPPFRSPKVIGPSVVFVIFISLFIKLVENFRKNEDVKKELINQRAQAELKLLRAQINPHFLFNTLNNIYSLSYAKSDKAPEMLLSLSDIMRYMIHDASTDKVLLSKEIEYLKNYVELEKLRIEKTDNINVKLMDVPKDIFVAPLLFIPFVENAFKHSRIVDDENAFISISLERKDDTLYFVCRNSIPTHSFQKDEAGGIGLKNIKKRLQLIYANKHRLTILQKDNIFEADLQIKIENKTPK